MNIAIVLSGGVGSRMGLDIPKQYVVVKDKPIIAYCLQTFFSCEKIDSVVIGVADEWLDFVKDAVAKLNVTKPVFYAKPGETRQYSIFNALLVAKENGAQQNDLVVIHDAARPLVSKNLITRCIEGCLEADGVMPVIPVKDTTYLSSDGKHIESLLNRNHLWSGQAPEAFVFGKYLDAHKNTSREELLKINGSTELAIKVGLKCEMISGDPINFKITTPEDLTSFSGIAEKGEKK